MKVKNYNQYLGESQQKMSSLRQPTTQEIEEAEKYLEESKDPDWDFKLGYFYIDVSGRYSVYYTLWRDSPRETHFITNLSTDFNTAVEKAKKASGRIPVIIDRTGTKAGLFQAAKAEILTFGKYRGKTIGDIFVEDPQYIAWLSKNFKGNNAETQNRLNYYTELYFDTITKRNQEDSKSQFVGKVGEKITISVKVYSVEKYNDNFSDKLNYKCKLIDADGNKFMTYNIGQIIAKDERIKLSAKVKDHREVLGVKFTILNYCKILATKSREIKKFGL